MNIKCPNIPLRSLSDVKCEDFRPANNFTVDGDKILLNGKLYATITKRGKQSGEYTAKTAGGQKITGRIY